MRQTDWWRIMRAATFGAIVTIVAGMLGPVFAPDSTFTAQASVALSKGDDKKDKKKDDKSGNQDEDHTLNGQVLEIDTLKDPPEMIVGSVDGRTVVKVLKTDEIALNGIRVGDYIEADGEKINEQLFEATQLSVSARGGADADADNDNKD